MSERTGPLTGPRVHAHIAAGLADPGLIDSWTARNGGGGTEQDAAVIDAIDLAALRRFAGFVTMVRQNPLRRILPLTLRALAEADLEIEAFAAYAPHFARLSRTAGPDLRGRLTAFADFLDGWLVDDDPVHAVIRDALGHELTVERLRHAEGGPAAAPSAPHRGAVPRRTGAQAIRTARHHPRALAELIESGGLATGRPPRPDRPTLLYWRDEPTRQVRVTEVTPLAAHLLALVDGRTTVGGLARRLTAATGEPCDADQLAVALQEFTDLHLLTLGGAAPSPIGEHRCG
ncbi:RiPP maturation protein ApyI [Kitasatospora sp. NPDC004531]